MGWIRVYANSREGQLDDFRILRDGACVAHARCSGRGALTLSVHCDRAPVPVVRAYAPPAAVVAFAEDEAAADLAAAYRRAKGDMDKIADDMLFGTADDGPRHNLENFRHRSSK